MSVLFSARSVCEQSLRKVGSYSINDMGADGIELAVALEWLDLNMGQLAGTKEAWWLVKATSTIPLVALQAAYDLNTILPATELAQFPLYAQWDSGNGNRQPVEIVTRQTFEELPDPTTSGQPTLIHIDRLAAPIMRVYPVPATAAVGSILLTAQTFAPDIAGSVGGNVPHGLAAAWQRWIIYRVASDIGDGPVRRMPINDLRAFEAKAGEAMAELIGFNNREHDNEDPISESSDCS